MTGPTIVSVAPSTQVEACQQREDRDEEPGGEAEVAQPARRREDARQPLEVVGIEVQLGAVARLHVAVLDLHVRAFRACDWPSRVSMIVSTITR